MDFNRTNYTLLFVFVLSKDYILLMLIDLHVHSTYSACSRLPLGDILAHARLRGLDGVCVTDHECMAAREDVREGRQADGLLVLVGLEYATSEGDILLFGLDKEPTPGLPAREILKQVRTIGGAAVVAHPCRGNRPASAALAEEGLLTAVETVNGRNSFLENSQARTWPFRYGLAATGGSDAHRLDELGRSPTRFSAPIRNQRDLVSALRQGLCRPAYPLAPLPRFADAPAAMAARA